MARHMMIRDDQGNETNVMGNSTIGSEAMQAFSSYRSVGFAVCSLTFACVPHNRLPAVSVPVLYLNRVLHSFTTSPFLASSGLQT
jgi:nitrate reductase gamma subunit